VPSSISVSILTTQSRNHVKNTFDCTPQLGYFRIHYWGQA
jgi:hypothetical protein